MPSSSVCSDLRPLRRDGFSSGSGRSSGSGAPNSQVYRSRKRDGIRFGGVFVMMRSASSSSRMMTAAAPTSVIRRMSGCASIQPRMPPARASTAMPSRGSGCPPKRWQRPETVSSSSPTPMPMRVLSCTELGWRKSQIAKSSMTTGQRERDPAEEPAEGPRVEGLGDGVVDEEPLDDGAGDREHDDEEGQAVAALLLRERLGAERAGGPARDVREPHPGAHEQRRAVRRGRLGLGGGRSACGRGRELLRGGRLGARAARGRARGTPVRPGPRSHAPTLRPTGDRRRQDAASVRDRRTVLGRHAGAGGCRDATPRGGFSRARAPWCRVRRGCRPRRTPRSGRASGRSCRAPRSA